MNKPVDHKGVMILKHTWRTLHFRNLITTPFQARFSLQSLMTKNSQKWTSARQQKKRKAQTKSNEGSDDEVLRADVAQFRVLYPLVAPEVESNSETPTDLAATSNVSIESDRFKEVEVKISYLSSTGNGLGLSSRSPQIYVVPFTVPGDLVLAKIVRPLLDNACITTDFLKVLEPSPQRRDDLVGCKYFSVCSGCQLQMLSYPEQLAHKKSIVERAYLNFSNLSPELVPRIGDTVGSPLQYGYRTKLTPHFDGPGGMHAKNSERRFKEVPPIGFMEKGRRRVLDIEDCPIGTEAVREGMKRERERVAQEMHTFKRGATLLLRENTKRTPGAALDGEQSESTTEVIATSTTNQSDPKKANGSTFSETKTCVTDKNALTTEYVGNYVFQNAAGAFFQNNNSILPVFTDYVRNHALPSSTLSPDPDPGQGLEIVGAPSTRSHPIKHLIDAYCGSGLFTITLSPLFTSSLGIDISEQSITAASNNATLNSLSNARFIAADATHIFADVTFPPEATLVVIDPPRKGCDKSFLKQLLRYGPERIVYVSCNVHTQARDVGILVEGKGEVRYGVESLRGFDFFPQTGHVEGVAVLQRQGGKSEERVGDEVGKGGILGGRGANEHAAPVVDAAPMGDTARAPEGKHEDRD